VTHLADSRPTEPPRVFRVLDWVLDRSVVLGYSRIGHAVRRRWWDDDVPAGMLKGRHVLITGATSGIGLAAAAALGRLGAVVHVLGHDRDHLERSLERLRVEVPDGDYVSEVCDISDLEDVRRFGHDLAQRVTDLHALLHNAGTMARERTETAEGHEVTVATHVLGPFLLTHLLHEPLAHGDGGRVVFTSSGGMYAAALRDDDPDYGEDGYSGPKAYARTKRMQVVLAETLAERLAGDRIVVHSMHPGWVDTRGVSRYLTVFRAATLPFMRSPDQGADTLVWLVASPRGAQQSGSFWHDRRPRPTSYGRARQQTSTQVARLWEYCTEATRDSKGSP